MDRIPLRNDYTRLPLDFKNEWTAGLRSDKYKQTKQSLRDNWGYCCLGVRCELSGVKWRYYALGDEWITVNESYGVPSVLDLGEEIIEILMQDVMPKESELCDGSIMSALTLMNDQDGLTFPQIADWIEKYL